MISLWDTIQGQWRRSPAYITTSAGVIDAQAWAAQGRWSELASLQIWEEWLSPDPAPLGYVEPIVEQHDGRDKAARYPAGTEAERTVALRQSKTVEIEQQVPDGSARMLTEDPVLEHEIVAYAAGASERKSELEDTADGDVAAFDTAVVPSPIDGAGYVQARMRTEIAPVEPWAGQPANDLALVVILEIIDSAQAALGSEARAHMFGPGDGPAGAVMPFTQDATNPAIWRSQTQDGRFWADESVGASMRLLWGSGSLPVAETRVLSGLGDKSAAVVRYGLP